MTLTLTILAVLPNVRHDSDRAQHEHESLVTRFPSCTIHRTDDAEETGTLFQLTTTVPSPSYDDAAQATAKAIVTLLQDRGMDAWLDDYYSA